MDIYNYDVNREKVKYCGDLVYYYQFFGKFRDINYSTKINYNTEKLKLVNSYRLYLKDTFALMRENYARLNDLDLPLCLGDVFVLSAEQWGITGASESALKCSARKLKDLISTNFGINPKSNEFPLFLTLTYKNPQFSSFEAKRDLGLFAKRLRYHLNINFRYIAIPEKHQSDRTAIDRFGSYHYHILLFDIPFDLISDLNKIRNLQNEITDVWGKGFSFLKQCYGNADSVAWYVVKYLTKDLSIDCGRRYLASYNCWKPLIQDDLSTAPSLLFKTSSVYTLLSGEFMRLGIYSIDHHDKN
jgi:hypothetical protein